MKEIGKKFSFSRIDTENLYIALIGKIDADLISEEEYINRGEHALFYTIVERRSLFEYYDIFNLTEYNFRDESQEDTILMMSSFPKIKQNISFRQAMKIVDSLNDQDISKNDKKGDNMVYIRTRRID